MKDGIRYSAAAALAWLLAVAPGAANPGAGSTDVLDAYNVVWTSPSQDMHGSMPIGNGDLAANVWVEPNGDLVFYLSRGDAWSGTGDHLLKLGRVRIRLDNPFFQDGADFRQELDLASGRITIESSAGGLSTSIQFWIDANHPVVNVEVNSSQAFTAETSLEVWRTQATPAGGPDTLVPSDGSTIRWYHRNEASVYPGILKNQHLGHLVEKYPDPLMHRTFGGLISGEGLEEKDAHTLVTGKPTRHLHVRVHALTAQTATAEEWIDQLEKQRSAVEALPLADTRQKHEAYWEGFWSRSQLFVSGTPEAEAVTRAYVLQRWIQAGAGRGAYPIKFNGSLFTVDLVENGKSQGPDARRWGGCYWFQNTREPYWAMLYAGDLDHMEPLWKMYREALPLLKDRTKAYFDHEGIFCSETIYPWGLNRNHDFGIGNKEVIPTNPYIRYYWDSGNELSMMMLDAYAHSQDAAFAKTTLIPIADEVVKFYDQHHQRNEQGKVHFSPAASLETWHVAEDPLPVVIGLKTVLTGLLGLPERLTSEEQRERWERFRAELPGLPFGEEGGKKWVEPARTYSERKNSENPELYAVFPYRAYGVGKPDVDVGIETWQRRRVKGTGGWRQDAIQAALLGLTEEARGFVTQNATNRELIGAGRNDYPEPRFPAFWGPNFDWLPDQCQGSVTMIALQRMLMQCDGEAIRLLPAWPKDWDVDFKLHAPHNTTVEGRVSNGELIELNVTPESRREDVIVF